MKRGRKYFAIIILVFFTSQDIIGQECDCQKNLQYLKQKVEANYAGFTDKVTKQTKSAYQKFYKKLFDTSAHAFGFSCYTVLNTYLSWFRDGHLSVSNSPKFKIHSDNVSILTLPSFDPVYKPAIDSLMQVNRSLLSRTKTLIIDLRTNYGGSTPTYQSVLPWIYTNPIKIESALYYSSLDNIEIKRKSFSSRTDSGSHSWLSAKNLLERMEQNPEQLVVDSSYFIHYDSIYKYPEKVIVLTGERCLSAGELFLITAMQSKKVTILEIIHMEVLTGPTPTLQKQRVKTLE